MHFKSCKATIDDLDEVIRIGQETFIQTFKSQNSKEVMEAYILNAFNEHKMSQELNNKNSQFFLCYRDNTLIGYYKLNVCDAQTEEVGDEYMEIERLYLLNDYQGQGYGSRQMQEIIRLAQNLGKSKLWLGVWEHNPKAILFYERFGFVKTGQHNFIMGDEVQTDYIYEREL